MQGRCRTARPGHLKQKKSEGHRSRRVGHVYCLCPDVTVFPCGTPPYTPFPLSSAGRTALGKRRGRGVRCRPFGWVTIRGRTVRGRRDAQRGADLKLKHDGITVAHEIAQHFKGVWLDDNVGLAEAARKLAAALKLFCLQGCQIGCN